MTDYFDSSGNSQEDDSINLFEKVLVASKRAKDIYLEDSGIFEGIHIPTTKALYEMNQKIIKPKITLKEYEFTDEEDDRIKDED